MITAVAVRTGNTGAQSVFLNLCAPWTQTETPPVPTATLQMRLGRSAHALDSGMDTEELFFRRADLNF